MKLELTTMPERCVAAVRQNVQEIDRTEVSESRVAVGYRRIGKAVCGGRQVEATADFTVSNGFSVNNDGLRAESEVIEDLEAMVSAMCIDCPNRPLSKRFQS